MISTNIYLNRIQFHSIKNKYFKWYFNIVCYALSRVPNNQPVKSQKNIAKELLGYTEGHHIWPKCVCSPQELVDSENFVFLSSREHIIVHWLMTKMFDKKHILFKKSKSMFGAFIRATSAQTQRSAVLLYRKANILAAISSANSGPNGFLGKTLEERYGKEKAMWMRDQLVKGKQKQKDKGYVWNKPPSPKGLIYVNNGVIQKRVKPNEIPPDFVVGKLKVCCPFCGYCADKQNFKKYHNQCSHGITNHASPTTSKEW